MHILPSGLAPLAQYRQFILIKFIPSLDKEGKSDKLPCDFRTGQVTLKDSGGAHNPEFWADYGTISQLAAAMGAPYGIGFVITDKDPIICLDLDDCAMPDGTWIPRVGEVLAEFPGAVELSNSGKGLHVWATYQGECPQHGKKSKAGLDRKWLELYSELRFIALGSACNGQMQDVTHVLPGFIEKYFKRAPLGTEEIDEWTTTPVAEYSHLDDADIMQRAMRQAAPSMKLDASATFNQGVPVEIQRASFADMFNANVAVLSVAYPSSTGKPFDGSDVEFFVAKELAYWTGRNCERVARLMQSSPLKRDKWLTHRPGGTYLTETIMRAVNAASRVFQSRAIVQAPPVSIGKPMPQVIEHNTFIGRENLAVLFNDCIYIQDNNAILLPNGDIVDQGRFNAKFGGYTFGMTNDNDTFAKHAWDAFLSNQLITFPRADGSTFRPGLPFQDVIEYADRRWINTYKEPKIPRLKGDVTPFLNLLNTILPRDDDAIIMLSYMAAVVQYKGTKFRWAPFVQGTPGNGKSTLSQCLKHALGRKYIFSVKAKMIENHFNAWLENNILYIADDIYNPENKGALMEELKTLISDEDQGVTYKGIDSIQKNVCGNFVFNSNHKDALKKTDDARRICTFYCAQQSKQDRFRDGLTKPYFNKLYKWLENGGYAMVSEYLYSLDIDPRYNPAGECQEAPDTSATREAIVDGRTGLEYDVAEWIELEEPGFCGDFVSVHMLKKKLEGNNRYSRSMTPLKIKEMMLRLGFEVHRYLPNGRTVNSVQPDGTKPILYVRRDTWPAEVTDANAIAAIYSQAQQDSITNQIKGRFNHG